MSSYGLLVSYFFRPHFKHNKLFSSFLELLDIACAAKAFETLFTSANTLDENNDLKEVLLLVGRHFLEIYINKLILRCS